MIDGFVFYSSFYKAIESMPDDKDKLKAYQSIIKYALTGEEPQDEGMHKVILYMAKPQIDANNKRRESGSKGGRPPKEKPMVLQNSETQKPMVLQNSETQKPKVKEKVKEKDKVKEISTKVDTKKSTAFRPPTIEEVREYATKQGYTHIDCERFVDFYESKAWFVGKNKMKDWKAAVRNWERSQRQELTTKGKQEKTAKNAFHNFEQRDIDFNDLEKQLDQMHFGGGE